MENDLIPLRMWVTVIKFVSLPSDGTSNTRDHPGQDAHLLLDASYINLVCSVLGIYEALHTQSLL